MINWVRITRGDPTVEIRLDPANFKLEVFRFEIEHALLKFFLGIGKKDYTCTANLMGISAPTLNFLRRKHGMSVRVPRPKKKAADPKAWSMKQVPTVNFIGHANAAPVTHHSRDHGGIACGRFDAGDKFSGRWKPVTCERCLQWKEKHKYDRQKRYLAREEEKK